MSVLSVDKVAVGYPEALIINELSVTIPEQKITSIIGPNGCGKSTLLKAIARVLKAEKGAVYLDGQKIQQWKTKDVAKKMAILPQSADTPNGLTVFELVSYGRFPHQAGFKGMKKDDYEHVHWAIEVTGLEDLKERYPAIGDVRGRGLMLAIEMVKDRSTKEPDPETTARVFEACRENCLILSKSGPFQSCLRLVPPMCLSMEDVQTVADGFDSAFSGTVN